MSPAALFVAAASIGILHMSAPDHWATLIILGRLSKWGRPRLVEVGVLTALGHVGLSVALGFAIVGVGLLFSEQLSLYLTEGVGVAMLTGGIAYGVRELRLKKENDFERETAEGLARGGGRFGSRLAYFAVLGAVLSPDLAILPVFLLAVPEGFGLALATAVVFGLASICALVLFLLLGMAGAARVFERIPPKYNDALAGFVVAAVGAYILVVS